jgi:transcriptional regulator with XRE-family HTH domain
LARPSSSPVGHFGRQLRKARLEKGWTLEQLAAELDVHPTQLSRVETGKRPPNAKLAAGADRVFKGRSGWFTDYYEESQSWLPPGLRSWTEYEDRAARLAVWSPGILHGLLETEDYAAGFFRTLPGLTEQMIQARVATRLERQRRVLFRDDDPPVTECVIDHASLYRLVESPEVMAAQMRHLLDIAALPNVTVHVLPAVANPAMASELIVADHAAAYCEHLAAAGVYTERETITRLEWIFTSIRGECYKVSESLTVIRKAEDVWTGESRVTAGPRARASKRPAATALS